MAKLYRLLIAACVIITAVLGGIAVSAGPAVADPPSGICMDGFVWREAVPGDHVCVLPATRTQTAQDNAQADSRRNSAGGPYGPDTCLNGYVWREAVPGDHVCVLPATRTQTAQDNAVAAGRVRPDCVDGAISGSLGDKWRALGGPGGPLGCPKFSTWRGLSTNWSPGLYGGALIATNGWYVQFDHGQIDQVDGQPPHAVYGAIYAAWNAAGRESRLGWPETDETSTPDQVGRYNHFQHSSIYWTASTGAHIVPGAIRDKWAQLGWEKSFLGYPLSDAVNAPSWPGDHVRFQGGVIDVDPNGAAHEVHGGILAKYLELGAEHGQLGLPLTDETSTPDQVGRYNHFQGAGSIYWTPTTGAHSVTGRVRDVWSSTGWEKGPLGYPISDTTPPHAGDPLSRSLFEYGTIGTWGDQQIQMAFQHGSQVTFRVAGIGQWDFFQVIWASSNGRSDQVETPRRGKTDHGEYTFDLAALGVHPGDTFSLHTHGCNRDVFLMSVHTDCAPVWTAPITFVVGPYQSAGSPPPPPHNPPPATHGVHSIKLFNCRSSNDTLHVWQLDSASTADGYQDKGELPIQYTDPDNDPLRGYCPAPDANPIELTFATGHTYSIAIVDPEANGCGENTTEIASCVLQTITKVGDDHGDNQVYNIP